MGYSVRDNDFYVAWDPISRDRDTFLAWMGDARPDRAYRGATADDADRSDAGRRAHADHQADADTYTADEMMTVAAARRLRDGTACFVGIGLPSTAANLARATHAPDLVLVYESGCLGAKPDRLPLSIGDGVLAETADAVVSVPEVFNYWLQPGRVDVGFLGAAQIDRYANINTTVIGADYAHPKVRLPGAGGRARDRRVLPRGRGRRTPEPAHLRRTGRLRDLGRVRLRARRPGAPRPDAARVPVWSSPTSASSSPIRRPAS